MFTGRTTQHSKHVDPPKINQSFNVTSIKIPANFFHRHEFILKFIIERQRF